MRVLIVEDEVRLAETLVHILKESKYAADAVYDGADGYDYAMSGIYDVIILDVMLPRVSGFDVVRQLRAAKNQTPVLMLSARSDVIDRVYGLNCGADDYLAKPFSPEELVARVRALSRRQGEVIMDTMRFGDLTLHLTNYLLQCGDKTVHLGFKEYQILRMLMATPNVVLSKDEILSRVWGADSEAEDNNAEAYISFLRKKFAFIGSKVTIATVRKVGYYLKEDDA